MKVLISLWSAVVLLATTLTLTAEETWTGRIVKVGQYYFVSNGRFYDITNWDHPDLATHVGPTVRLTGELRANWITVSKVQVVEPETQLKRLFHTAVAFSAEGGDPLHYKAYAIDPHTNPAARPIGFAFWTTQLVPEERGYRGPIIVLVGMDTTGTLTGVTIDYDSDPYGYFSVDTPEFAAQFRGKSIRDPFRVGGDIDAVSGATVTVASATRAIRDSARLVARRFLTPDAVKP